ncbi:MAG TPA: DUF1648 domain-containing protein [Terriglobales bacterium]|nr:DUF1648 domain-containing protein [Terriglobales bacterium]
MTRTNWRTMSLLPWLVLPLMLLRYWQLQDALPEKIAVHFSLNNVPNGWSDKGSFAFGFLGMTVGMLALFTVMSFIPRRPKSIGWALMLVEYAVSAVMCLAFLGVLEFNALNRPELLQIAGRVAIITPIVVVAAVVISVVKAGRDQVRALSFAQESSTLTGPVVDPSQGRLLAEEAQRAPLAGVLLAAATAITALAARRLSSEGPVGLKILLYSVLVLLVWITFQAFDGFHYRVTTSGVEVRTGGIRLCSIPKARIQEYRAVPCDPLTEFVGWGWRWARGKEAFLWHGHEAVRIRTPGRDFYLGHDQPERLVRDLDAMMKSS